MPDGEFHALAFKTLDCCGSGRCHDRQSFRDCRLRAGLAAIQPTLPNRTAAAMAGPASVADLAEGLLDAVVNISTSQSVKNEGAGPQPVVPEQGSPFQEFFNDFFDKQGKDQGNRKVNSLVRASSSTRRVMS